MKKSNKLKSATNPRVYKLMFYDALHLCCSPHKGCNRMSKHRYSPLRSWKTYRGKQYKQHA